jgi:hypothetical protein
LTISFEGYHPDGTAFKRGALDFTVVADTTQDDLIPT